MYDDELIPQFRKMVRAVQKHGARIGPELHFGGRVVNPEVTGLESWGPSAVPYVGAAPYVPHAMSKDQIAYVISCFEAAALRAKEAGCDFIGLHGAHGYLISAFLSPYANKRDRRIRWRSAAANALPAGGRRSRAQGDRTRHADHLPGER